MASLSANARSIAARTVHIKMYPTAQTLPERREVLRVLEQFGEVTMFRSYKYHPQTPIPNAFLSLFSSPSSAQEIINASPIRYRLISSSSSTASLRTLGPVEYSSTPSPTPEPAQPPSPEQSDPAQEEKVFELHISPSSFNHTLHLTSPNTNPLHGPYTPFPTKRSFIGSFLEHSIPSSIWAPGLRDWETDGLRWRNNAIAEMEHKGPDGGKGVERRVAVREKRRREKALPRVMRGLRGLRKEEKEAEVD